MKNNNNNGSETCFWLLCFCCFIIRIGAS